MRNQELLSLRPKLSLPDMETGMIEQFQNATLRPILKYQHDLLVLLFKNYVIKRKNVFDKLTPLKRLDYIQQVVKTDVALKNRLAGLVIGHFTNEEYIFFSENEPELLRRLTDLIVQRLQSVVNDSVFIGQTY